MSGLLRICTAGSVDDGKSTLIGRLLYDSRGSTKTSALGREGVEEPHRRADRLLAVHRRPARPSASRASRSTSPTATSRRRGASSSSPTRRATSSTRATWRPARRRPTSRSCSSTRGTASATQSRRHARIARLLGITDFVLAVNKMDLVDFDRDVFDDIVRRLRGAAARTRELHADSAQRAARRQRHHAERPHAVVRRAEPARVPGDGRGRPRRDRRSRSAFRCSSWSRPTDDFRGYAGQIASGTVRVGDRVTRLAVRPHERVKRIVTWDGDLDDGVRADVGHADARGRDRHQPRRHAAPTGAPIDVGAAFEADSCGWTSGRSIRRASTC